MAMESEATTGTASENDITIAKFAPNTFDPFDLKIIGLDTEDGPEHCLYVDNVDDELHEEDILNVMANGIIQPVLFRKNGAEREIVVGRHRVRWLREANKRAAKSGGEIRRIRAFQFSGDESKMGRCVGTENSIRHQPGCVTFAKQAVLMRDRGDNDQAIAIALGYGKDTTKVKRLISLLDLDKVVLEALENGDISESTGYTLAPLSREEQVAGFKALMAGEGKVTVDGAKRVVAASKATKKTGKKKKVASAAPKKVVLKRLAELQEIGTIELEEIVDTAIRWATGLEVSDARMKRAGLTDAVLGFTTKPVVKKSEK